MDESLPEGWMKVKLKEVGQYINGRAFKPSEWKTNGLPIIRIQNLTNSTSEFNFSDQEHEPKYLIRPGDLLMAWSGSLGAFIWKGGHAWLNQHIFKVDVDERIVIKKYLYYSLKISIDEFYDKTRGSGIVHITKPTFESHEVPLPPLAEQARIISVLDGLMGRIRSAQEQLETVPKLIKRFRQAVLSEAVSGVLTEDWRDNNDSVKWAEVSAANACEVVASGSTPKGKPFFENEEIPYLKVYNIVNQKIDFFYKPQFIKRDVHERELKRCRVYPNDVLINIVGPPLGKVAIVPNYFQEWNINQAIVVFRPKEEVILSKYLYYVFCEGSHFEGIENETRGTAGQSNISLTQCRNFLINIPSLPEQQEIIQRVNRLMSVADALEDKYQDAKRQLDAMPSAILAKAFAGELTAQDPNDEPASVLLTRIRSEKEAEQLEPKQKKPRPTDDSASKTHKKMAEQLRAIKEILAAAKLPVPTRTVWQQSVYKDDIEAFYADLKKLVDEERSVVDIKEGDQSYLTLANAN